jgi:Na+/H+ antiporter NhaD/arsenite permease-like protein
LPIIALVVVCANAGGVWSPMGDVTTTMLWLNGKISTVPLMQHLFLPALLSMAIPTAFIAHFKRANHEQYALMRGEVSATENESIASSSLLIGVLGILLLLAVPISKAYLHMPVYILMLLAMAILWASAEWIGYFHHNKSKQPHTISSVLQRIDTPSILFFVGLLLAIAALEKSGYLHRCMDFLQQYVAGPKSLMVGIGLLSAIIDNVPLVAAGMKMLPATEFPNNSEVWYWLAFCAGTGGSLLVIGSAAGVAAMGMEKLDFMRYLRIISLPALVGLIVALVLL